MERLVTSCVRVRIANYQNRSKSGFEKKRSKIDRSISVRNKTYHHPSPSPLFSQFIRYNSPYPKFQTQIKKIREFQTPYSPTSKRDEKTNPKPKPRRLRNPLYFPEEAEFEEALESLVGTDLRGSSSSSKTGSSSFVSNLLVIRSSMWPMLFERRRALKVVKLSRSSNSSPSLPLQ